LFDIFFLDDVSFFVVVDNDDGCKGIIRRLLLPPLTPLSSKDRSPLVNLRTKTLVLESVDDTIVSNLRKSKNTRNFVDQRGKRKLIPIYVATDRKNMNNGFAEGNNDGGNMTLLLSSHDNSNFANRMSK